MKKSRVVFIILAFFLFVITTKAQTVYVSENGKKFHKKNCDLVKTGKNGIDLKEAKKQGLEACKHCKPEEAVEPKKEKAPAKSK